MMPNPAADDAVLAAARASLAKPLKFSEFLAKLGSKDRASAERRVAVLDAEGNAAVSAASDVQPTAQPSAQPDAAPSATGRGALWQRLACSLMTLAPHAAKLVGKQTLQLYVADGKYRMQVFALEDLQDGKFTLYAPDVLKEALDLGVLTRGDRSQPDAYLIEPSKEPLEIKELD